MVLPIHKGDPVECGSYRGIKLLEHAMKVVERIFEYRIRQQIDIDDMQFGFMNGKRTTDAMFIVRQMQEKFRAKCLKYFVLQLLPFSDFFGLTCKCDVYVIDREVLHLMCRNMYDLRGI